MIEIKNVNKYFNKGRKNEIHAINNTSLSLPDSGLIALLGESGCGKTTMLNVIGGLDKVKSGNIIINGQKITRHNMNSVDRIRNLNVGYIFQDYKLMDDMTVYDNVALALKMIGIKDKAEQNARIEYVLDKVGILRYRKRPAATLSGGERQRVGIARALVKNPDIILADEPTGNLDSKNSVEIMNIIKKISKDRLVILVTHERNLATFYADRVIEVVDGKVVNDYENTHNDSLDYEIDNVFYLKDFENHSSFSDESANNVVNVYSDGNEKLDINIIVRNGNIYIQSVGAKNVELIDDNSGIDVVDDYKREIDKESISDYDFDMSSVCNQNIRKRYSSIFNVFTGIFAGFKKIFGFSVLRKLLLLGFAFVGFFIVFAVGEIGAINHVDDSEYIKVYPQYIKVERAKMSVKEYKELTKIDGVDYVLPVNSLVSFKLKINDYYQTLRYGEMNIVGSLASTDLIKEDSLVIGHLPEKENEIVIDKRIVKTYIFDNPTAKNCGVLCNEDIIGRIAYLDNSFITEDGYEIVGIVDSGCPGIYAFESQFTNILEYTYDYDYGNDNGVIYSMSTDEGGYSSQFVDYKLYGSKIKLATKNSKYPSDYEVLLPESEKDIIKIGKKTNVKIGGVALKVSGYYKESSDLNVNGYLVNTNTVMYNQIVNADGFVVCAFKDVNTVVNTLKENNYSSYGMVQKAKELFEEGRAEQVKAVYAAAGIILLISAIEMFLMSRSSFLSRIKEVGTLRAIGVKKFDIYKMFLGEAVAITTLMALPAMLIMYGGESFIAKKILAFKDIFYMPVPYLIATIILVYSFNIFVSLLPVWNVLRKRPAAILSRFDVD